MTSDKAGTWYNSSESAALDKLAFQLEQIEGIERCKVWDNTDSGHERIYIELPKLNGGKKWNGGSAGTVYFDNYTKTFVVYGNWAGARTRDSAKIILNRLTEIFGYPQIERRNLEREQRKVRYGKETT